MSILKQLEMAKAERDRVPLGCYAEFCRANERVRDLYDALARR